MGEKQQFHILKMLRVWGEKKLQTMKSNRELIKQACDLEEVDE